jgi:chromosome segregation ATPase
MSAITEMTPHRLALSDAVAGPAPGAALAALDASLRWAIEVLRDAATDQDDLAGRAFELLEPLATALGTTGELAAALPAFLAAADAGGPVDAELEARTVDLVAQAEKLAAARAEARRRTDADRGLAAKAEEYRRLMTEIEDLGRAEELAADLPRLRALREDLRRRSGPLRGQIDDVERAIESAAAEFVELAEPRLAWLSAEVRKELAAAVETQRRLRGQLDERQRVAGAAKEEQDRLSAQLAAAEEAVTTLAAANDALYADLDACAAADAEITASLGGLRDAELLLRTVDEKLAAALAVQDKIRRRERAMRFPGDPA